MIIKYLSNTIVDYFGDGKSKGITIKYIHETEPLGTIGALSTIENFNEEHILLMNSDILTNIDFEDFFKGICTRVRHNQLFKSDKNRFPVFCI